VFGENNSKSLLADLLEPCSIYRVQCLII